MDITTETATSLGNKLAEIDLTDDEAALLGVMFSEEPDVVGFDLDKSSTKLQELRAEFGPLVTSPLSDRIFRSIPEGIFRSIPEG